MESCYKNTSKIRNVTFIFQKCKKKFQKRNKMEKYVDFKKLINSFEMKRNYNLF